MWLLIILYNDRLNRNRRNGLLLWRLLCFWKIQNKLIFICNWPSLVCKYIGSQFTNWNFLSHFYSHLDIIASNRKISFLSFFWFHDWCLFGDYFSKPWNSSKTSKKNFGLRSRRKNSMYTLSKTQNRTQSIPLYWL